MAAAQFRRASVGLTACAVVLAGLSPGGRATLAAQGGFCPPPPPPGISSPGHNEVLETLFVSVTWSGPVLMHYLVTLSSPTHSSSVFLSVTNGTGFGPLLPETTYVVMVQSIAFAGCETHPQPGGIGFVSFKTPQRITSIEGNLAFGDVEIDTTTTRTFTIHNSGWSPALTVNSISYPEGFSGDWAGGTIASGESQTVTVTFEPTAVVSFGGTITLDDNHTSGTSTIEVSGMGAPPPPLRVVWRNTATGQNMGWQLNGPAVAHAPMLPTIADPNWEVKGVGDFDADGSADVLWRNRMSGENIAWLMNLATVSMAAFLPTIADTNWQITGVGDLDGDLTADVIFRNATNGQNLVWLMNGTMVAFSAFLPTVADTNWEMKAVGDFDGSGRSDVILRNRVSGQNIAWLMNGASVAFSAFMPTIADTNWQIVGTGDLDGDMKADVFLRHRVSGQNVGWLMNGVSVAFSLFLPTVADTNWEVRSVGDLDDDGRADIVWRNNTTGQNAGWFMNGLTIQSASMLDTVADLNWRIVGS